MKFEPEDKTNSLNSSLIQDKIVAIAKASLKPYYVNKKIDKESYKIIMKKVVNKVSEPFFI